MMTIKDIARYLGVSESMIRGIEKKYLKRNFGKPKRKRLKVLAIDEIYIGKSKKFLTIAIDWTTGAIVFVGEGKGEKALKPFWKRLQAPPEQLHHVLQQLKEARVSQGLSLVDLTTRTGVEPSLLLDLETEQGISPTMETLVRYAEAVGKRLQISLTDT